MNETARTAASVRPKVHIRTFGCQMNEYDSEAVAGLFERGGWAVAEREEEAGVVILNTCSVRGHAEDRAWGRLFALRARAAREPGFVVAVMGCMAQRMPAEIARRCPWVRVICGTRAFDRMVELVERAPRRGGVAIDTGTGRRSRTAVPPRGRGPRVRAFVEITRGCGNRCAYCVVPYVRGPEESRQPGEILAEIGRLAEGGCREVTLLGQNVNSYRACGMAFAGLLREVGSIGGIARIRFMTSHPKDFPDELLEAVAGVPQVCPHIHLPLQSGSDRILAMMNRGYTGGLYRGLVERLRGAVPGLALSTDLIAGFPAETEEDFRDTLRAIEEIRFDGAFIFKYSDREGTRAAGIRPKVPQGDIVRRHAALLGAQERISAEKNAGLIGATVEVLVEGTSPRDPGRLFGRTGANRRVVFPGGTDLIGRLACVTIRGPRRSPDRGGGRGRGKCLRRPSSS